MPESAFETQSRGFGVSEKNFYDDLLRHQLTQLSTKVPELEQAFQGNQLILNVCVAYSRKVAAENVTLRAENETLRTNDERQDSEISELRVAMQEMSARMDRHGNWITEQNAKMKGKQ